MENRPTRLCKHATRASASSDVKPFLPGSDFCIAVSGFKPPGHYSAALFAPTYATKTLHVLGRNDVIVVEERSKTLLEVSSNKRVEYHDGGQSNRSPICQAGHWWAHKLRRRSLCALESELAELPAGLHADERE